MSVVSEEIEAHAAARSTPEHPVLAALAAETRDTEESHNMMVGLLEGRFLETMLPDTQ